MASGLTLPVFFIPMKIKKGETVLRINMSFAAAVTLMLILDESGYCALSLFCCIVHELGHIACLAILGEKPLLLELSFYGIRLERKNSACKSTDDIAVYIAGPCANLVLSAVFLAVGRGEFCKAAAAISAAIGFFNLLPCRPLDGGNILYAVLCRRMTLDAAEKISFLVSSVIVLPLFASGVVLAVKSGNFTLAAVSLYIAAITFLHKKEKDIINM